MSTIHNRLQYALASGDFGSLTDELPTTERDRLLTLITLYGAAVPDERRAALDRLRGRLEEWLRHTLDQRLVAGHIDNIDDAETLRRVAARTQSDFYDWLTTTADADQVAQFVRIDGAPTNLEALPLSVLYRLALDAMLAADESLEPERTGARALNALLPIPEDSPNRARVMRGARWRDDVDARYLRDMHALLATHELEFVEK
jgi:hypothetical protein